MGILRKIFKSRPPNERSEEARPTNLWNLEKLKRSFDFILNSTSEQSAATHETMASIEEIRSMLAQTDQHIARSLEFAEQATDLGKAQKDTVKKMQIAMGAMKDSNELLKNLQASLLAIKNKTHVINDIVAKTQLLSFNASIEAARAGQFGKGFAVVAEEVGRLAQTSGKAAKEIESLINESQQRANDVVTHVISRAEEGIDVSEEVINSFGKMTNLISHICSGLNAMTSASREQLQGIEQTTVAIGKISKTVNENHKNAVSILELTRPSKEMLSETDTEKLVSLVDHIVQRKPSVTSAEDVQKIVADDPTFKSQP